MHFNYKEFTETEEDIQNYYQRMLDPKNQQEFLDNLFEVGKRDAIL